LNYFENLSVKMRKKGEKPQNTTNFIFVNRSGMGEVSILSIPDLNLLFIFTTTKMMGVVTEYNLFD
jgi:hypothetical protein